jgi:hypothetical protein
VLLVEGGLEVVGLVLAGGDTDLLDDEVLLDVRLDLEVEISDRPVAERLVESTAERPGSGRVVCPIETCAVTATPANTATTNTARFAFMTLSLAPGLNKLLRMIANIARTPCLTVSSIIYIIPYLVRIYSLNYRRCECGTRNMC